MLFIHLHPSHVVVLACLSCILLYSLSLVFVHVILCTKIVAHSVFVHAILAFVHVILAFVHVILAFVILPNRQLLICIFSSSGPQRPYTSCLVSQSIDCAIECIGSAKRLTMPLRLCYLSKRVLAQSAF